MNITTMRRADRWLGVPACLVLSVLRVMGDVLRGRRAVEVRRILFVKLAEQGSTVLAHAAITKAIERVGRENVYFLAFEMNRFILDQMRLIPEENVLTIPDRSLTSVVLGSLKTIVRLRALKIDAAIDMEFFARSSAVLSYLSGARVRVGYHSFFGEAAYRGDLMTHRLSFNAHLHASQVFQVLVDALDVPPDKLPTLPMPPPPVQEQPPMLEPSASDIAEVRAIIERETGRPDPPLVLLNANCSDLLPLRRWPIERYVELARRTIAQYPEAVVAFTGAPEEAPPAERLVAGINDPRCVCLAGKTTLQQLLVLYHLSRVLVTNDSGPAHFATLTPIRIITMFGPETPVAFGARTPRNEILWAGIACSPCVNAYNDRQSACRDNVCMQGITVDQVFEKLRKAYEGATQPAPVKS